MTLRVVIFKSLTIDFKEFLLVFISILDGLIYIFSFVTTGERK